ncbi:unnamed protein product, partial [marine sediment metagenome]
KEKAEVAIKNVRSTVERQINFDFILISNI